MGDGWLTTRNKPKLERRHTAPSRCRTSLSKRSSTSDNKQFLLTQNSPPPKQLLLATKQSSLTNFFKPVQGVDELQEIPFQPDSEILPAGSKYGDGESKRNQSIACGESEKHSKSESKNRKSYKREYRKDHDGHIAEATSCEKQTAQRKRKCDVVYTQSVYSEGDVIEKTLDNDSHISSSRKVKMKRQKLGEVSDSSKNTERDVLSSLPSSLEADKDTHSDMSGSLEQFEVDCLKMKSDANTNVSENEHEVEGSCVDSEDNCNDTYSEAIKDSETMSFLNNFSSTSISQSLDLNTELTPSSMSFLNDLSSTNTAQTLDFDNEFTLQSQRERYDAMEKEFKDDIKLNDDLHVCLRLLKNSDGS